MFALLLTTRGTKLRQIKCKEKNIFFHLTHYNIAGYMATVFAPILCQQAVYCGKQKQQLIHRPRQQSTVFCYRYR